MGIVRHPFGKNKEKKGIKLEPRYAECCGRCEHNEHSVCTVHDWYIRSLHYCDDYKFRTSTSPKEG